ncbi:two-component regulator propeller domain-containing protein [uncultured Bacteroides sp.]|uniref:hybrid sensor histidine kinase/response regulator transcription factor n=1 Tax=uncultured Bacteroides sp. TaxID=162156 RepID=UPI002AABBCFE|nr:two-component regulator propeller domain-containing protein [uncultured Bacteroides sp.]
MRKYLFFLCLYLFIPFLALIAQPLCKVKPFSVNNGLSNGFVSTILQDQSGYIWFSTWNGLNRYDGYEFRTYKALPGDGCTLTSNRISCIWDTRYDDIWCQTYDNRIYLFDTTNEKFIDVLLPTEKIHHQTYNIKSVYPLKKGISWIICNGGNAFRVDDRQCKNGNGIYQYGTYNQTLKGNSVFSVFQDSQNDEWILTDKGINIIGKKKIRSDFPFQYIKEYGGSIFLVSSSDRIAVYNIVTQQLKFIKLPDVVTRINTVEQTKDGSLLIGTNKGLLAMNMRSEQYKLYDIRTSKQPINDIELVFKDSKGYVWMFTKEPGVVRLNMHKGDIKHFVTSPEEIIKYERKNRKLIFEDKVGTVWVVPTDGNFSYFDPKSNKLASFMTEAGNPKSIFAPNIINYFIDHQGNCWLACNRGAQKISFFPHRYEEKLNNQKYETRCLFKDSLKRIWVASKNGAIRIFNQDGSLFGYLNAQGTISKTQVSFERNVYCIFADNRGIIWMGTKKDGLFRLNAKSPNQFGIKQYIHQDNDLYSISHNSIYTICQDDKDRVWIGTYGGGLNLLQEDQHGNMKFLHSGNILKNYPDEHGMRIRHISKTPKGVILIGTTDGLITFSEQFRQPEEIKFYRNMRIPQISSSLSGNDIMYTFTDKRNRTYVATLTGGINKILSSNLLTDFIRFKHYTMANGLGSDLVSSISEDTHGYLWAVSENSLSKFDPNREVFDNFSSNFIQQESNFSEASSVFMSDNRLLLGTDIGLLTVNTDKMRKSRYIPNIVFTGLKIQGKAQEIALNKLKVLSLKPSERNVTFQFAAIDFTNPDEINYAYKLKGLEKNWNYVDKNRTANYINLPPGEYELQIRSTNGDGFWVNNVRSLSVHVLPTFWETYWAWILYLFLFVCITLITVYILFYIYRLRHQVNIEQELAEIKLKFFTDISHEFRTPLTLISSPVNEVLECEELSLKARNHLTLVQKNTERMLRLVNQILDFRKIQNKKMRLFIEETDISELLNKVMGNFNLIAKEKQINYSLQTDGATIYAWIDRDKFEKILFNLLSNAFKYTSYGKSVKIGLSSNKNYFSISVTDEGIGIEPSKLTSLFQRFGSLTKSNFLQPSSGIGLSLVKEMVELHHGDIQVKSELGKGSEFRINLPLRRDIYEADARAEFILNDSPEINNLSQKELECNKELAKNSFDNEEECSILIVEDNYELRSFLRDILNTNYQIIEASNGKEGVEKALQFIPDLIISDVMMPIMDGLDMVKEIKENRNTCHIPIILLSAKSSLDDRIKGLEQGIDDYITKPFSSSYLKARIVSLLKQRQLLQEMYMASLSNKQGIETSSMLSPSTPKIASYDELFIQQIMDFMEEQMDNSELTIDEIAENLMLSRTVFYKKLRSIVGLSPVDFIREIRIKRAAQLIETDKFNFSQVAYMTGFNDPKYFSKCFKKQMKITPSEYKDGLHKKQ